MKYKSGNDIARITDSYSDSTNTESFSFQLEKYERDTSKICSSVIAGCDWVLNTDISFSKELEEQEQLYVKNKDMVNSFFRELKEKLENKDYECFYQSVDGME